jgi:hypothetical protein
LSRGLRSLFISCGNNTAIDSSSPDERRRKGKGESEEYGPHRELLHKLVTVLHCHVSRLKWSRPAFILLQIITTIPLVLLSIVDLVEIWQ